MTAHFTYSENLMLIMLVCDNPNPVSRFNEVQLKFNSANNKSPILGVFRWLHIHVSQKCSEPFYLGKKRKHPMLLSNNIR